MENQEDVDVLHVVLFPWLATGHLIPFFHLSKCLASNGHRVSFVSTPRNLSRLPRIPQNLSPLIDFVSLTLPRVENLPDHAESSMDILNHQAPLLKMAFDLLKQPLETFLENSSPKPDWIVYDYASYWVPTVAAKVGGVSCAYFSLFNAANMAFIGPPSVILSEEHSRATAEDFTVVPGWIPTPSEIVYRLHEIMKCFETSTGNELVTPDLERFAVSIAESDVVLFRTCVEFEPEWFNLICELYEKPVVPVGFLPPSLVCCPETENDDEKWVAIKFWLDNQRANSVVYVALGTEATLSEDELAGLALGLEQSRLPFFWVLRKPPGSTRDELERLPVGFVERVKDRGIVFSDWAPQVSILGHEAVGGFLTHCGWNSVIEGLSFGRVLILFPVMNDQGLNARLLEGKKLGIEIPRNEQDGSFTSESVADSVRTAMVGDDGAELRSNTEEAKALFGSRDINKSYVDSLVKYFVNKRRL